MKAIIGDLLILSGVATGTAGVWIHWGMAQGLMCLGAALTLTGIGVVRSA